jgi:hypothetical protein
MLTILFFFFFFCGGRLGMGRQVIKDQLKDEAGS